MAEGVGTAIVFFDEHPQRLGASGPGDEHLDGGGAGIDGLDVVGEGVSAGRAAWSVGGSPKSLSGQSWQGTALG